jgi:hypothetical protein
MSERLWLHAQLWLLKYKPTYTKEHRILEVWQTENARYGFKGIKVIVYSTQDVQHLLCRVAEEITKPSTYFGIEYAPSFTKLLENPDNPQSFLLPEENQGGFLLIVDDRTNVHATAITSPSVKGVNFKKIIYDVVNDDSDDNDETGNDDEDNNNDDDGENEIDDGVETDNTYTGPCPYFPGEFWGFNFTSKHTIVPTDEKTFERLKQKLIDTGCKVEVDVLNI